MALSLGKAFMDLNDAMNTVIKLEGKLNDQAFFNDINRFATKMMNGFTQATCKALHRLKKSKPSCDIVKQMVEGIPSSLSYKVDASQMLPVQSAVGYIDSIKYLPVLAKEGIKHNVGGIDNRGGLLAANPRDDDNWSTLQLLVSAVDPTNVIPFDTTCVNAMKELRKDGLLVKTDVSELLYRACHPAAKMRFEYLAEWDPDSLMTGTRKGVPHIHSIINIDQCLPSFTMYLRTSLKYYPQHIGCLFQKDNNGKTAVRSAIEEHGVDEAFKAIKDCIPTDTTLPILHHAAKDAPEYFNDFSVRYPSAIYLRDENGRSFKQAQLAAGTKTFENDCFFFLTLSDDEIAEVDPVTKQYPFLTAATTGTGDLSTVYFLLSKNPSLLDRYREQVARERTEEQEQGASTRKRSREIEGE
eukprot:scaffold10171_cov446-Chaetoceros_neogracile.AAC.11